MKNLILGSLVCLGLYFLISLPISLYQYNSRYYDYKLGNCSFDSYQIIPVSNLYSLESNLTVSNCTREMSICCNDYNYWIDIVKNNNTECYYNRDCEIVPYFIKYTSYNLFEISSFIIGVLFAINIIVFCESKRKIYYLDYEEIN